MLVQLMYSLYTVPSYSPGIASRFPLITTGTLPNSVGGMGVPNSCVRVCLLSVIQFHLSNKIDRRIKE